MSATALFMTLIASTALAAAPHALRFSPNFSEETPDVPLEKWWALGDCIANLCVEGRNLGCPIPELWRRVWAS